MRSLKVLPFILILSLASLFPMAIGQQPPGNSEELKVSILGSTAHWKVGFVGPDFTLPSLKALEGQSQDLMSYRIVVAWAKSWKDQFIPFSSPELNLLDFPIPPQGVILQVRAANQDVSDRFASKVGELFNLQFFSYTYQEHEDFRLYYSHGSFDYLVKTFLWKTIPPNFGGFANLIPLDLLLQTDPAFFSIYAKREEKEYSRRVDVMGISEFASKEKGFNLESFFARAGNTNASKSSLGSRVEIKLIGGFMGVKETAAKTKNFPANTSSVVEYPISPGKPLPKANMTMVRSFPIILATRSVDEGALRSGQTVEVKVTVRNIAQKGSLPAENVRFKEDWWSKYFTKIEGATDIVISSLQPGEKKEFPYQLAVAVNTTMSVTQSREESIVTYSYKAANETVTRTTYTNPVRIFLNSPGPSMEFHVSPTIPNPPLASDPSYTFSVRNKGSRSAFNLKVLDGPKVLGERDSLERGGNWTFVSSPSYKGIVKLDENRSFILQWTEEGKTVTLESNSADLVYDTKSVALPFPQFSKSHKVMEHGGKTYLNFTLSLRGPPKSSLPPAILLDKLSPALRFVNGTMTERDGSLEARIDGVKANETKTHSYLAELPHPENFVLPPAFISWEWRGSGFSLLSESKAFALGLRIEKSLSPKLTFAGAQAKGKSVLTNLGENEVRVANLTDTAAPYKLARGSPNASVAVLGKGMKLEVEYTIKFESAGSGRVNPATASFVLSGEVLTLTSPFSPVHVFEPLKAYVSTVPASPVEKRPFEAIVTLENPSNLTVHDVKLTLPEARYLSIISGNLSKSWPILKGGEKVELRVQVQSDSGREINLNPPDLHFRYDEERLQGKGESTAIRVMDDITSRYLIPTSVALFAMAVTVFLARRVIRSESGSKRVEERSWRKSNFSYLSLLPSTNSMKALFASLYGIWTGGCLKQYAEALIKGPDIPLWRASFVARMASIITPPLL